MIVDENTIADPSEVSFGYDQNVGETVTLSGARRYQVPAQKLNLTLYWASIDATDKGVIDSADALEASFSITLDGTSYTVVSFGRPQYQRLKGTTQLWSCQWELREP